MTANTREYKEPTGDRVRHLVSDTKTRPANTTDYASGDVINESASAGTVFTFSNIASKEDGGGVITQATIIDSANQTTKLNAELWLFRTAPTSDNDNAAFTPTDAELLELVGVISFSNVYVGDATSGAGGNVVLSSGYIHKPFVAARGDNAIYGVLVARNAYTPVSGETFTVILDVL